MLPTRLGLFAPDLLRRELERLLGPGGPEELGAGLAGYPIDVREDDDFLYVDAEMPGFRKEEIDVRLEEGVLTLQAERKPEELQGRHHLQERRFLQVQRALTLPTAVDPDDVDARFEDGVLRLRMRKRPETRRRRIELT